MPAQAPTLPARRLTQDLWRVLRGRVAASWRVLYLGALALALSLSPSSWRTPWRAPLQAHFTRAAWPLLPWFALLSAIVSVVVIRIVLVTAHSYGLSQYALGMVVRVLVLELIPLSAAFAVALWVTLPLAAALAVPLRPAGRVAPARDLARLPLGWLRAQFAPRVLAGALTVLLLALVSSLLALVLAYLLAHGPTPFALEGYTRLVGRIFEPVVALVFVLKTGALALAVSVLPLTAAALGRAPDRSPAHGGPQPEAGRNAAASGSPAGALRLTGVVLAIEILALLGNYLP